MAFEQNIRPISLPAGEDLTDHQWRFVKIGSDSTIVKAGEEQAIGVLQVKPTEGEAATVATSGISYCESGGKISPGDLVAADDKGRAVVADEGDEILGTAVTEATDAGHIFSLLVNVPSGVLPVTGA